MLKTKKILCVILIVMISLCIAPIISLADEVTYPITIDSTLIPDETFREYITGRFDDNPKDGKLSQTEVESATQILYQWEDEKVSSVKGIEIFTNLNTLCLQENNITNIDVSKNTNLKSLACSNNKLTKIDLSKNINLESIECRDNYLTNLDLKDNTKLKTIICYGNNLEYLDIRHLPGIVDAVKNGIKTNMGSGAYSYKKDEYRLDVDSDVRLITETTVIDSIEATVTEPKIGENPKFNVTFNVKSGDQTIDNAIMEGTYWYVHGDTIKEITDGSYSFEPEKEYSILIYVVPRAGYEFSSQMKGFVNDKAHNLEQSIFINSKYGLVGYKFDSMSYNFITGETQTFTGGKISEYRIELDGNKNEFKSLAIGELNLVEGTDYTVEEGSTIIIFTNDGLKKLNTLAVGEYDVNVNYNNQKEPVKGKLVIEEDKNKVVSENNDTTNNNNEENKSNNNTEAVKEDETKIEKEVINNPQTGDNIVVFALLIIVAMAGIIFIIKNKKTK